MEIFHNFLSLNYKTPAYVNANEITTEKVTKMWKFLCDRC